MPAYFTPTVSTKVSVILPPNENRIALSVGNRSPQPVFIRFDDSSITNTSPICIFGNSNYDFRGVYTGKVYGFCSKGIARLTVKEYIN